MKKSDLFITTVKKSLAIARTIVFLAIPSMITAVILIFNVPQYTLYWLSIVAICLLGMGGGAYFYHVNYVKQILYKEMEKRFENIVYERRGKTDERLLNKCGIAPTNIKFTIGKRQSHVAHATSKKNGKTIAVSEINFIRLINEKPAMKNGTLSGTAIIHRMPESIKERFLFINKNALRPVLSSKDYLSAGFHLVSESTMPLPNEMRILSTDKEVDEKILKTLLTYIVPYCDEHPFVVSVYKDQLTVFYPNVFYSKKLSIWENITDEKLKVQHIHGLRLMRSLIEEEEVI